MDIRNTRLKILLQRFHNKTASQGEIDELKALIKGNSIEEELKKIWDQVPEQDPFFNEEKSAQILAGILRPERVVVMPKKRRPAMLMAAAAVLALVFAGTWVYFNTTDSAKPGAKNIVKTDHKQTIMPGSDKAKLTLSDGTVIVLDSTSNGTLALQGNSKVIKLNGQVVYNKNNQQADTAIETTYNTLSTPRGGQYMLTLEDGTKVWLNAASSIKYPSTFGDGDRTVDLTGEAYFEVAKDTDHPFSVQVNGVAVNVLGTHFNVMSYENEEATAITLLEGAVNVTKDKDKVSLRPGQQALLKTGAALKVINNVNLEETIAWKNGYFQLDHTPLAVLMRQVERWYNVDVVYEGKIPNRQFGGKIPRKSDIRDVIKILGESKVYSRIEGHKIIILDK